MTPAPRLPRPHTVNGATQAGDPGPQSPNGYGAKAPAAPGEPESHDDALASLAGMAKQGIRYQAACLTLLSAYSRLFAGVADALSHMQPVDIEACKPIREELASSIAAAERALQPVREAAE